MDVKDFINFKKETKKKNGLRINDRSEARGKRLSSSNKAKSPSGRLKSMSRTGRLSENSTKFTGIPSARYSYIVNYLAKRNESTQIDGNRNENISFFKKNELTCCSHVKICWLK